MALISGEGKFTITGATAKLHDLYFYNDTGVEMAGGEVTGCWFAQSNGASQVSLLKTSTSPLHVYGNQFTGAGIHISAETGEADYLTVTDNLFYNGEQALLTVGTSNQQVVFSDNACFSLADWTVELVGVINGVVADNTILDPGDGGAEGAITADANSRHISVSGNVIQGLSSTDAAIHLFSDDSTVTNNSTQGAASGSGSGVIIEDADSVLVASNTIVEPDGHGIVMDTCTNSSVKSNLVSQAGLAADDTYDGIQVTGGSDVSVVANDIVPSASVSADTRYGLNIVSGNDHVAFANNLGDSSEYGTADSVDGGTNTRVAASGGVIGGQFAY